MTLRLLRINGISGMAMALILADPSHTYTAAGSYTAVLTVRDAEGLEDQASVVISVNDPDGGAIESLTTCRCVLRHGLIAIEQWSCDRPCGY